MEELGPRCRVPALKAIVMDRISPTFYEEIVFRAGMQVCGGNLSLLSHADPR
jgi:hypothetical protein